MSSKKVYLIRHGQTDYNLQNIVQGSGVDSNLNDTGRSQASRFYKAYQDVPFDKVYTSVLRRSIQSVQGFLEKGIPHEAHATLNEICWGRKEGKKINLEDEDEYVNLLRDWSEGRLESRITGGENPAEVAARLDQFVEVLVARPEEETVLICMHGRAMRILLCRLLDHPMQDMDRFEHHNLCLYLLEYTGTEFILQRHMDVQHLIPEENEDQ